MLPYQAKPFGALPEEDAQASPRVHAHTPHPKLGHLPKLTLAMKPELPLFQIHLWETRN